MLRNLGVVAVGAWIGLASGLSGCVITTSTTGGDGGGNTTTIDPNAMKNCAKAAHASCMKHESCSLNGFQNNRSYGSEADCEARATAGCNDNIGAMGGGTTYSVDACVAAEANETCQDFEDSNPPAACIAQGTLANGSPCGTNGQCKSTFCDMGPWDICGTCADLPSAGASCYVQSDCGRNMACVKDSGSGATDPGTCAAWVLQGGSCDASNPCADGLSCVGSNSTKMVPGICQPAVATVGAACDRTRATMPSCDGNFGLTCIATSATTNIGTCQAIQLAGPGEACGSIGSKPVTAVVDCRANARCIMGTCVAAAADGAPCDEDPTLGPGCISPAKCVSSLGAGNTSTAGVCTMPNASSCM